MRRVETYRGSKDFVLALEPADLEYLTPTFDRVRLEWAKEWQRRGCKDEGSCCLGVGVSVYYLRPGKRKRSHPSPAAGNARGAWRAWRVRLWADGLGSNDVPNV